MTLYCDLIENNLQEIPNDISQDIIVLNCSNNNIEKIENLPDKLQELDCSFNKIKKIENLPDTLLELDIIYNRIQVIENLPSNLQYFVFDGNPIQFIDNIPFEWFNRNFSLSWYNCIKIFQRKFKLRFARKTAAILIGNACHDWIYAPICKDGTVGIVPRLLIKKYAKIFNNE